jgi:hypothetical protein
MDEIKPGDKVKINVNSLKWQEKTLTPKFLEFIDENVNTIFTVKAYLPFNGYLYTFVENDTWLFYVDNLIKL